MAKVQVGNLQIEYERFGPNIAPAVILVQGMAAQMIAWPIELCLHLVAKGFQVVRFDNRDVGLSSRLESAGVPDMHAVAASAFGGPPVTPPYSLDDMASDTVGLLTALDIEQAHVVGASMGGMIAQLVAADYPQRTLSLTSIMSTTGNPELELYSPEALKVLLSPGPTIDDFEALVEHELRVERMLSSPSYPADDEAVRAAIRTRLQRSYDPMGIMRQAAACAAAGDRRPKLRTIRLRTIVLHGEADPLIPVSGGHDTAANIANSELRIIPGMGHNYPIELMPAFASAIGDAACKG
jgi:pimeloyl-ACP methyl ester carboxylesterase